MVPKNRVTIPTAALALILAAAVILLFSACASMHHSHKTSGVTADREAILMVDYPIRFFMIDNEYVDFKIPWLRGKDQSRRYTLNLPPGPHQLTVRYYRKEKDSLRTVITHSVPKTLEVTLKAGKTYILTAGDISAGMSAVEQFNPRIELLGK